MVDKTRLLFSSVPAGAASGVLTAAVVAWVLRAQVPGTAIAIWLAWFSLVHAARLASWRVASRDDAIDRAPRRWLRWYRIGTLGTGSCWAALPILLYPADPLHQLFVALVIAASCGALFARLSADTPSALLFMLPAVLPTSIRLLASPNPVLRATGALGAVYFAYLLLATRGTQAAFHELSRLRSHATRRALHDPLTGLANRHGLGVRLPGALAHAHRHGNVVAVGMIDLDDFKPVNDTWGHAAGDALLIELARRLQGELRGADFLVRLGGDEFVIVIGGLDELQAVTQLQAALQRLHRAVEAPFEIMPGVSVKLGLSMGLAMYPNHADDADTLLRLADAAMYQAKQHKGRRVHWWRMARGHDAAAQPDAGC